VLSKCANPACSSAFRYLHEGKLFLIESEAALQNPGKSRTIDYVWLCSSCCRSMTVHIDPEGKIRVVRKPDSERTRVGNF
jgi:hypothetical protein